MTFLSLVQYSLLPFLFLWLGVCVRNDLRSREVPVWMTVIPLAVAGLIGIVFGRWSSACLVAMLILLSDLVSFRFGFALLGTAVVVILDPTSVFLNLTIFAIWLLWDRGAMGGADAKILITLLLVWGSAWLMVWVALSGGLQGLVAWWRKQREIPYTVAILLGSIGFWLTNLF
jgi:Flp pilus assembly protein protease CpaA